MFKILACIAIDITLVGCVFAVFKNITDLYIELGVGELFLIVIGLAIGIIATTFGLVGHIRNWLNK